MTTPPMVERMARAMCRADFGTEAQWGTYVRSATAALYEMREPEVPMVRAGDTISGSADDVWTAMIDAARTP